MRQIARDSCRLQNRDVVRGGEFGSYPCRTIRFVGSKRDGGLFVRSAIGHAQNDPRPPGPEWLP